MESVKSRLIVQISMLESAFKIEMEMRRQTDVKPHRQKLRAVGIPSLPIYHYAADRCPVAYFTLT